jgi:hypothetical protein
MNKPDRLGEIDQAATTAANNIVNEVEGDIREFVRRDVSVFRRPRTETVTNEGGADNINTLIQRVSGASIMEIERVIAELTQVRDLLRSEGERVQREIAGYASLSQAAMTSMKIFGDSMAQWKPQGSPQVRKHNT